jgi:hypothetical protein
MRCFSALTAAAIAMGFGAVAHAVDLPIANHSFEAPIVNEDFLPVALTAPPWVLTGPGGFIDLGQGQQNTGTGIFPNPDQQSSGHFENPDGNQLAYIFTNEGTETPPPNAPATYSRYHQFLQTLSQTFAAGKQYDLTVSVANAGAAPGPNDRLEFALVYSSGGTMHRVATRTIMNNGSLSSTRITDFTANSFILAPGDPAVGQQISVLLTSTGAGGTEFVMDNVRASFAGGGDANRDGTVNADDLALLAHNWQHTGGWTQGDFTIDGFVDIKDLYILANNWPNAAPAIAAAGLPMVPEPGSTLTILAVLGGLGCRVRRNSH